jgi:purine-binding chemotaxis protein CheW
MGNSRPTSVGARPLTDPLPAALADAPELSEFFLRAEEKPLEPAQAPGAAQDLVQELLLFALGGELYALPVPLLREIVMPPPLSEVPRAGPAVLGVTMIRGEVVPVFDVRRTLRLGSHAEALPGTRVIIVDAGEGPLGLWVDRVVQVVRVRASQLEEPPRGVAGEGDAVVRIGRQGERLYGVLDLEALLRAQEAR